MLKRGERVIVLFDAVDVEGIVLEDCADWGSEYLVLRCCDTGDRLRIKGWLAYDVEVVIDEPEYDLNPDGLTVH